MNKRESIHSFRDIDSSLFRDTHGQGENTVSSVSPEKKSDSEAENADESALFLEAVAGNIDTWQKNTPVEKKSPPKKKTNPPFSGTSTLLPVLSKPQAPLAKAAPAKAKPQTVPDSPSSEDERLFADAMDGVHPVRAKGRDLAPLAKPAPRIHHTYLQSMDDIFTGKLEFSLEYTNEFIQGRVVGMDVAIMSKLRAGAFSPEGHLDLHGQNLEQAYATLATFIKHAYQNGKRHLLIITGRGKNSPGGTAILRERVQSWFTRDPFKRVVLAFCTAKPSDGGGGALYLLLRKRKKIQGKIVWDRRPSEEELLL